jgi:hypothetical protein
MLEAAGVALPCERLEAALRSFGAHYARLNRSSRRPASRRISTPS